MKPGLITAGERHLRDVLFAFSLALTSGRVPGFESYKIQRAIEFDHDLLIEDYPVTDATTGHYVDPYKPHETSTKFRYPQKYGCAVQR